MKRSFLLSLLLLVFGFSAFSQTWAPQGDRIKTVWAETIDVANVLPEYPRPLMVRSDWVNLNGLWDYAIQPRTARHPADFEGQILVPFPVQSSLSGVMRAVTSSESLWYNRTFTIPSSWKGKRVLLHFGAVDWQAEVWVNGVKVGSHEGGYTAFSFDITDALVKGENKLQVKVWDPTDNGPQPRGKQVNRPEVIWYTAVTGIWQTVWMEPVSDRHIVNLKHTSDIGRMELYTEVEIEGEASMVEVVVSDKGVKVASAKALAGERVSVEMPQDAQLWSPENPALYDVEVVLYNKGKVVDRVKSYAALRLFSTERDSRGVMRLCLNHSPLFQYGPLDQGWWPDGLYTAPSDEALIYDVQKTKDFGFNMIRKHVKVEPSRWYYHCDRLGVIVWQDMPSGDRSPEWQNWKYFDGTEMTRTPESEAIYRKEWKAEIDLLYSHPCIGVWVPFNESWGQFKTPEIVAWTKSYDPTRLVNPASGGNHYTCGDILDLHHYAEPKLYLYDAQRATVLGEYGGIGLVVKDHLWVPDRNWGYVQYSTSREATDTYVKFAKDLLQLIEAGFSAAVYTQTSDVEIEVNGLMTYDRKVIKLEEDRLYEINRTLCGALNQ